MKVLDLFSGIGGFSLGLERAGMETVAFCEMDEHCQKVLKKHWPLVPIIDDVKRLDTTTLDIYLPNNDLWQNIDVICGGFPCQDISVAGLKKGIKGERSGLWKEFHRLIAEVKPKFAIIENVANLRSEGLAVVIKDLWKIGYNCEWHIIPARAVGAHHLRERIWIIARAADRDDFRFWPTTSTPEEESKRWAKATFGFRNLWGRQSKGFKSQFLRIPHGVSGKLDKGRKQRIKQLGNAVVPQIPEMIGRAIMDFEAHQ